MIDRYDHEMEIIDDSIKKVELSRDRYQQLEQENEVIQASLTNLRAQMSSESKEHGPPLPSSSSRFGDLFILFSAKEVHEINASTRVMREQMEAAFRKELVLNSHPSHLVPTSPPTLEPFCRSKWI
jgi:hypothetical protein